MEWNNETSSHNDWEKLVQKVREVRKQEKITQARLAAICGLSSPTISRFENGEKDIQMSTVLKIINALGIKISLK